MTRPVPTQLVVAVEWRRSTGTFAVHDPADGSELARVADATAADGLAAVDPAAALPGWAATPPGAGRRCGAAPSS